ncbi:DUF6452 family protein [Sediminicola luteus]|uniref:Uncharacterized protein n=1 Tax=Sediminicola luteus TaxID=319238 RepID=A0A2A4G423_9FLAO|nr:DUF6452 family protein [Sediminicola luteus]PCE62495.1 hypothetical protein B7P33_17815 [Sediminicola luteus]
MLLKRLLALVLLSGLFWLASCEKDDICVDGDTPRLIIEFYDTDNVDNLLPVPNLRIIGENGEKDTILVNRQSLNKVELPLKVNTERTEFRFIINAAQDANNETGNIDELAFDYMVKDRFVSRACGFVANYEGVTDDLTNELGSNGNWIDSIEVVVDTITNENDTHVKIFH